MKYFTIEDYKSIINTHSASEVCAGSRVTYLQAAHEYLVTFCSAGVPVIETTPTINGSLLVSTNYGGSNEKFYLMYNDAVQCIFNVNDITPLVGQVVGE